MIEGRNSDGTFAKGHKGFKPKGSRNRFTVAMMDELLENDLHPMKELKRLYRETDDDKIKFSILKEMLGFGKDKQFVEVESVNNQYAEMSDVEFDGVLEELYTELQEKFGKP